MVLRAYIEERGAIDTDMLFVTVEEQPISGRSIQSMLKHTVILPELAKRSSSVHTHLDGRFAV